MSAGMSSDEEVGYQPLAAATSPQAMLLP